LKIVKGLLEGAVQRQRAYGLDVSDLETDLHQAGGRFDTESGAIEPLKRES